MKERPILFNALMVRAILDGSKTQTRRFVKLDISGRVSRGGRNWHINDPNIAQACPYGQPGDRLWVRETFAQGYETDPLTGAPIQFDAEENELPKTIWYRATDNISWSDDDGFEKNVPWRPSIHMPRAASRIDLLIKSVRVDRLQNISEADCWAEGIDQIDGVLDDLAILNMAQLTGRSCEEAATTYAALWDQINGAGTWEANPWVWVIEFKRTKP